MRKLLLATTALAAAGAFATVPVLAADKMSVGVSGYMQQWIGIADQGDGDDGGVAQFSDSEFYVKGRLEADNGLTFSVKIEVEGNGTGNIDESQATVRGSFGEIVLGAEDPAMSLMHYGNRDVGVGLSCGDVGAWIAGVKGCSFGGLGTSGWGTGDRKQISYFTPRLSGVQFGATYIPNSDGAAEAGNVTPMDNDKDAWSVGLNYKGDLGGSSVALSLGHYQKSQVGAMEMLKSGTNVGAITVEKYMDNNAAIDAYAKALMEGADDLNTLAENAGDAEMSNKGAKDIMASKADAMTFSNFGLQVGFGAFSFDVAYAAHDGGAYMVAKQPIVVVNDDTMFDHDGKDETDPVPETADLNNPNNDMARTVLVKDVSQDYEIASAGVKYTDGPMAVSLSHMMADFDDGGESAATMLSFSYGLAPGIVSRTSLIGAEQTNGDGTTAGEGTAFVTGITIGF